MTLVPGGVQHHHLATIATYRVTDIHTHSETLTHIKWCFKFCSQFWSRKQLSDLSPCPSLSFSPPQHISGPSGWWEHGRRESGDSGVTCSPWFPHSKVRDPEEGVRVLCQAYSCAQECGEQKVMEMEGKENWFQCMLLVLGPDIILSPLWAEPFILPAAESVGCWCLAVTFQQRHCFNQREPLSRPHLFPVDSLHPMTIQWEGVVKSAICSSSQVDLAGPPSSITRSSGSSDRRAAPAILCLGPATQASPSWGTVLALTLGSEFPGWHAHRSLNTVPQSTWRCCYILGLSLYNAGHFEWPGPFSLKTTVFSLGQG